MWGKLIDTTMPAWGLILFGCFFLHWLWHKLLGDSLGRRYFKKRVRQAAVSQQCSFFSEFRWQKVSLKNYPRLDHVFYETMTAELSKLGFRSWGEVEYLHVTAGSPNLRTAMRLHGDSGGLMGAGVFHLHVAGLVGWRNRVIRGNKELRVLEFQTALSDGRFVSTNNAGNRPKLSSPPEIQRFSLGGSTPVAVLYHAHLGNVRQVTSGSRLAEPVQVANLESAMEMDKRQHILLQNYRRDLATVWTKEEMDSLAPNMDTKRREAWANEVQEYQASEKDGESSEK